MPIPQVHIVYDQDVKIENLSSNVNDLEHNNQVIWDKLHYRWHKNDKYIIKITINQSRMCSIDYKSTKNTWHISTAIRKLLSTVFYYGILCSKKHILFNIFD